MLKFEILEYGSRKNARAEAHKKIPGLVGDGRLHSIVPLANSSSATTELLVITEHPDE